jgi:hypothetical protein
MAAGVAGAEVPGGADRAAAEEPEGQAGAAGTGRIFIFPTEIDAMAIIEKEKGEPFDNGPIGADGQYRDYAVLPQSERDKDFVRPLRGTYRHLLCDALTSMGLDLAEIYARDPKYYGATFCLACRGHFPVADFVWEGTSELVGS